MAESAENVDVTGSAGALTVTADEIAIADDDTRGVTVTPTALTLAEADDPATDDAAENVGTYTVVLTSRPTATVTVGVASAAAGTARAVPASLTFAPGAWNTPQTVTVTAVDDAVDNANDKRETRVTHTVSGGDYGTATAAAVAVTVNDDDAAPGVTVSPTALTLAEVDDPGTAGAKENEGVYTIGLDSRPTGNVRIDIGAPADAPVNVNPVRLDFSPTDWGAKTVTVTAVDDAVDNPNDKRTATLTHSVSAVGTNYSGETAASMEVTVTDDDTGPPTVTIVRDAASVTEGESAGFTVTASSAPASDLTVSLTVSENSADGRDFVASSNEGGKTVSIGAGQTTASYAVATVDNDEELPSGAVTVTVTGGSGYVVGSPSSATVAVHDNDGTRSAALSLSAAAPARITEGEAAEFTVRADGSFEAGAMVARIALSGSATARVDYRLETRVNGEWQGAYMSFTQSELTLLERNQPVRAVALRDDLAEADETLTLTLTGIRQNPFAEHEWTATASGSLTVTIADAEPPRQAVPEASFALASQSAAENAGVRNVRVNLSPAPRSAITLAYTVGGTARAGSGGDFTIAGSGSIAVASGAASVDIPVTLVDDGGEENDETVVLTLTGGAGYTLGSPGVHTLTITDDDATPKEPIENPATPVVFFEPVTIRSPENGNVQRMTLKLSLAPESPFTLNYEIGGTATPGQDFTIAGSGSVLVSPGEDSVVIVMEIHDDGVDENEESVILTLLAGEGYSTNEDNVCVVHIVDNDDPPPTPPDPPLDPPDPTVVSITAGPDIVEGEEAFFYLTADPPPASGFLVWLRLSDAEGADFLESSIEGHHLMRMPRSGSVAFTVPTVADSVDEPDGAVTATLDSGAEYEIGNPDSASVLVLDDDEPPAVIGFARDASAFGEDAGEIRASLTLTPPPTQDLMLEYAIGGTAESGADFVIDGAGKLAVAAGAAEAWITVALVDDFRDEDLETLELTLHPGDFWFPGDRLSHTVTIHDNDTAGVTSAVLDDRAAEGGDPASYALRLASEPVAAVTISVTGGDRATASPQTLNFDAANWNEPQLVAVVAKDNRVDDGDADAVFSHRAVSLDPNYADIPVEAVTVRVIDDDEAGVLTGEVKGEAVEGGGAASYTLRLATEPVAGVAISVTGGDRATASPQILNFHAANWNEPQLVAVTATDNRVDDGDADAVFSHRAVSLDPNYADIPVEAVTVRVIDDDEAGVLTGEVKGEAVEGGGAASYTLRLATEPVAGVIISVTGGDRVAVAPKSLTFDAANWSRPQVLAVVAVDNGVHDGDVDAALGHAASSADPNYDGIDIADVTVAVIDDDPEPPSVTALLPGVRLTVGERREIDVSAAFGGEELVFRAESADRRVVEAAPAGAGGLLLTAEWEGGANVTVTAFNGTGVASIAFPVEVVTSAAEIAALEGALAEQARMLLNGASDVIGERFRAGRAHASLAETAASLRDGEVRKGFVDSLLAAAFGGGRGCVPGGSGVIGARSHDGVFSATAPWFDSGVLDPLAPGAGAYPLHSAACGGAQPGMGFGDGGSSLPGAGFGLSGVGALGGPGLAGASEPGAFGAMSGSGANVAGITSHGSPDGMGMSGLGRMGQGVDYRASDAGFGIDLAPWGRSFAVAAGEEGEYANWTLWGAGEAQTLDSRSAAGLNGEQRSVWLGADRRVGENGLIGFAVSRTASELRYLADAGSGELKLRLTALYPYFRAGLAEGAELWALAGVGGGSAAGRRERSPGREAEGDLNLLLGAAGFRRPLARLGAMELSLLGDAGLAELELDNGTGQLSRLAAPSASRVRAGLEGRFRGSGAIGYFLRFGARYDGGDGLTGGGAELAAGLLYEGDRFSGELKVRHLRGFGEGARRETGLAAVLNLRSRADRSGFSFTLTPSWGEAEASPFELWGAERLQSLGAGVTDSERGPSVDGKLSWGRWSQRRNLLVSPFVGYTSGGMGDNVNIGFRLEGEISLEVALTRSERGDLNGEDLLLLEIYWPLGGENAAGRTVTGELRDAPNR